MKRILFLICLFVILQSSSAFCSLSVDDYKQMEIEGKEPTYNEITQDQTSYENWVSYVDSKTDSHYNLPSFSDVATLTENLLAYSVGNYADVASGVFDNLVDTFSLGSDIWDFMTFNVQQMAFDYLPDFVNLMKSGVDDEIYTTSSGGIVGNWVSLPAYVVYNGESNYYSYLYDGQDVFVCNYYVGGILGYALATRNNSVVYTSQSKRKDNDSNNGNPSYYNQSGDIYNGSLYSGHYVTNFNSHCFNPELTPYANISTALADFFGNEIELGDSVLNGQGIIVNDNPIINPVSLTSALGYPFKETVINNYNNNTPIPWRPNNYNYVDYNYNFDVPFWEGAELETIAYPEEIEFPSVEFETVEVDENIDSAIEGLSGWIIEFLLISILLLILGLII